MASRVHKLGLLISAFMACSMCVTAIYNPKCHNNVIAYHGNTGSSKSLSDFCNEEKDNVDVFILSFVDSRDTTNGDPNFMDNNISCNVGQNCSWYGDQVSHCQGLGKQVFISIGGQDGRVMLNDPADAEGFAQQVWDSYLGGSGQRPFGTDSRGYKVIFDGIDLDIENTSYSLNWGDFTRKINELSNANDRRHYFISGAPIIPPPVLPYAKFQPMLQILQDVSFDFLFIQAYNNPDYENENSTVYWDFWDSWARAKNPSPKLIYGLPGSKDSARDGYQAPDQAQKHISYITNRYPYTFGGAGVWNDATASDNSVSGTNFLKFLKNNLGICNNCAYEKLDGPCREGYPCCSKWGICGNTSTHCNSCNPFASLDQTCDHKST